MLGDADVKVWGKQDDWGKWMKFPVEEFLPGAPPLLVQPWTKEKLQQEQDNQRKRKQGPTPEKPPLLKEHRTGESGDQEDSGDGEEGERDQEAEHSGGLQQQTDQAEQDRAALSNL